MINLQLLDVVATAALRACLVDVDLHVWASWSSTRCWPGPGGAAAGRSWSMSSTRTCSCSMCWPRPRYAPAWWTWICMSWPAGQLAQHQALARPGRRRRRPQLVDELDQDLQLVDGLWICMSGPAGPAPGQARAAQLVDVVATVALRACLVDVDLHVWASWPSTRCWPGPGGAAAPPAAAGR
ncbi:hypothetical protein A4F85_01235 [Delftia sp. GW456-R20]|uniref:hypothetical protein n=1 Tax=Delftia sp. GW456-R20 TaxID=1827145 RepID=UPI0007B465A0|nr:hypothetical protein [Delftia sp. GW456-R20]KZK32411.1 hypothetical protein A4F85_01235 [Delftia sp. GW456-R20]